MAKYQHFNVDNTGVTIDPNTGMFDQFINPLIYSDADLSLTGNITINPTNPITSSYFEVRWEAKTTLNSFSVIICGEQIAQDCLVQQGTFCCYYDQFASPAGWTVQYFPDFSEKPQTISGVASISVPTSGTLTLNAGVDRSYQRLVGSPTTLLGSYTVSANAAAKGGEMFLIEIAGGVTTNGNTFNVLGLVIPSSLALSGGGLVIATYDKDGGVWRSVLVNKEVALNNIAAIAPLSIVGNPTNASGYMQAMNAPADGTVLQRIGNTLGFNFLSPSNFANSAMIQQIEFFNLSNSQLLDLFNTPVQLLSAADTGYAKVPVYFVVFTYFDGSPAVAYDTNLNLRFFYTGSSEDVATADGILGFTGNIVKVIYPTNTAGADANITTAQPLNVAVASGNPLNGTGTIAIGVCYTLFPPSPNNILGS